MPVATSKTIVIDACCLLNLCAARKSAGLLDALGYEVLVPDQVLNEARFLRQPDPDAPGELKEFPLDLTHRVQSGRVKSCKLVGDEEIALFVDLAMELADGEAACIAIAKVRGIPAATDDHKARRIANERGVGLVCTPELMKGWAGDTGVGLEAIKESLENIQRFARYIPRPDLPESPWWRSVLG